MEVCPCKMHFTPKKIVALPRQGAAPMVHELWCRTGASSFDPAEGWDLQSEIVMIRSCLLSLNDEEFGLMRNLSNRYHVGSHMHVPFLPGAAWTEGAMS